jgi:hypothetical protein
MPWHKNFLHFCPSDSITLGSTGPDMEWNSSVAETKSIHAVMHIAAFVIEYQYYLFSVKTVCVHFKRKHTSHSSQKHENYSALLQGHFALGKEVVDSLWVT